MLKYVDRSSIDSMAPVPPDLTARVLGDLHSAGVANRRRRRVGVVVTGVVGALAAALILVAVFTSSNASPPSERAMALQGSPTVTASALLVKQPWGTSLHLQERGLPSGQIYTVSMETSSGRWWTAGTYRAMNGGTVSATMACAVSLGKITGVRVVNGEGVTVLSSLHSSTSTTYN